MRFPCLLNGGILLLESKDCRIFASGNLLDVLHFKVVAHDPCKRQFLTLSTFDRAIKFVSEVLRGLENFPLLLPIVEKLKMVDR